MKGKFLSLLLAVSFMFVFPFFGCANSISAAAESAEVETVADSVIIPKGTKFVFDNRFNAINLRYYPGVDYMVPGISGEKVYTQMWFEFDLVNLQYLYFVESPGNSIKVFQCIPAASDNFYWVNQAYRTIVIVQDVTDQVYYDNMSKVGTFYIGEDTETGVMTTVLAGFLDVSNVLMVSIKELSNALFDVSVGVSSYVGMLVVLCSITLCLGVVRWILYLLKER